MYLSKWVSINETPLSKLAYRIAAFLYIDDTDLVVINNGEESEDEIVARAQLLLDQWQFRLQITGGELKISKCF